MRAETYENKLPSLPQGRTANVTDHTVWKFRGVEVDLPESTVTISGEALIWFYRSNCGAVVPDCEGYKRITTICDPPMKDLNDIDRGANKQAVKAALLRAYLHEGEARRDDAAHREMHDRSIHQ